MLNLFKKTIKGFLPKQVVTKTVHVQVESEYVRKKTRLTIAEQLKSLYITSPITEEDEGFNDGIDAAIKKVLDESN